MVVMQAYAKKKTENKHRRKYKRELARERKRKQKANDAETSAAPTTELSTDVDDIVLPPHAVAKAKSSIESIAEDESVKSDKSRVYTTSHHVSDSYSQKRRKKDKNPYQKELSERKLQRQQREKEQKVTCLRYRVNRLNVNRNGSKQRWTRQRCSRPKKKHVYHSHDFLEGRRSGDNL